MLRFRAAVLRATLRDRVRPRPLSLLVGRLGGWSHRDMDGESLTSLPGASSMRVSSSLKAEAVGDAGPLLGDTRAGDVGLLPRFVRLEVAGSRGTNDLGGCAFRMGGSNDSDRSSNGLWRAFLICSLSCRRICRARSSSTSSGLSGLMRSCDLVLLLLLLLHLLRSRPRRSLLRSGVRLRARPPRERRPRARSSRSSSS